MLQSITAADGTKIDYSYRCKRQCAAEFDYTPYGEQLSATDNTAGGTDYLFTGKERQEKLGVGEL